VKSEKARTLGHSMEGRLRVIQATKQHFAIHPHFNDIDIRGRQQIAGLLKPGKQDTVGYRWFGSMKGAGKFQRAIKSEDENLSLALDLVPNAGDVSREVYLAYIDQYKKAFPNGRHGIGTATRLLAMKRPDLFVCIDKQNKKRLCAAFGIGGNVDYESYWDSIIQRIRDLSWWCSQPPHSSAEREVWEARAAFLDSMFYDE
jgi:hypothetical protein